MNPKMILNQWSLCLYLQNARVTGMSYHIQYMQSGLGTEPSLVYVKKVLCYLYHISSLVFLYHGDMGL